jgi:hypothetical protein
MGWLRGFSIVQIDFQSIQQKCPQAEVAENLRREGIPVSDQGAVWDSVRKSLEEHHLHSRTADFQDVRRHVSHQIEEFVQGVQPIPGMVGAVLFGKRGVIGAEYLDSPDLFG